MKFSPILKRICYFTFFIFATLASGQETILPLTTGGWVGGLSGNVGWDNYNSSASNTVDNYDSKTEGFGFTISSRNGQFVMNNLSVGFDFQWNEHDLNTKYSDGSEDNKTDRLGFFGLWSRYYIPFIGTGWAIFPEVSLGYGNFKSINDPINTQTDLQKKEISADGFAYNLGFGATMFVSNNVAFETTLRYQGGTLKGDLNDEGKQYDNLEIELSNIDIIFGIMIYLR